MPDNPLQKRKEQEFINNDPQYNFGGYVPPFAFVPVPSPTPSPTSSTTPTPTPTITITPTITFTPTPTTTITPSITPSITPTLTTTPTPSQGSSYEPEYQAILNYATTQGYTLPSNPYKTLQNALVKSFKTGAIWNDLDIFYVFASDGDENFAKINWKNPGVYTIVENGSVDYFTGQGFKPTTQSTSNFLSTQFSTQTNKSGYTQNDASRFVWDYDATGAGVYDGEPGGPRETFRGTNSNIQRIQQDNLNLPTAFNNAGVGFKMIQRTSSTNVNMYNNSTTPTSYSVNSATLIAGNQQIFRSGTSVSGSWKLSLYGLGASLSGKETSLYNAINTYMTSI